MSRRESREGETPAKRPVFDFRAGMVKVAVWQNEGTKGPFPTAAFSRIYKGAEDTWKVTSGFDVWDLADVARCAFAAEAYMHEYYPSAERDTGERRARR